MIKIQIYAAALCSLLVITGCGHKETSYLNPDAPALWLAVEDCQTVFWQQRAFKNRSFQKVTPAAMKTCLSEVEVCQASRLEVVRRYKSNQSEDIRYFEKVNRKMWDRLIARTYQSIIRQNDKKALKRWIAYKVQPGPALVAAAQHNNLDAMTQLLKAFPDQELKESLVAAVRAGHLKMVILLASHGASLEYEYKRQHHSMSVLDIALENKQEHIAQWIIANHNFSSTFVKHSSVLHQAVRLGNMNLVQALVEKGMGLNNLDYQNATPLLLADIYKRKEIQAYLTEQGAIRYTKKQMAHYVRQLEKDQRFSTWQQPSPLIHALNQYDLGYACFILENGESNKAFQPLLIAIDKQWEAALIFLLQKGVNINQANDQKQTALIKASQAGFVNLVGLLLNKGAAVNLRDKQNLNALFYAAQAGHWMVVERLLAAGADKSCHDFEGRHILFFAEQAGEVAIVERVLRQTPYSGTQKEAAQLKLNTAIISGENKLVEDQVEQFLKSKVMDDPLYYLVRQCISHKKLTLLKKYLKDDMNLQYKYSDGQTMLHLAVQSSYPEMVAWLLLKGADKTELNSKGLSAEDYARQVFSRTGINVFDMLHSRTQNWQSI